MKRIRSEERGQTIGVTVAALVLLIGMAAFVVDVGSWLRADRRVQQVADAAALAGAQQLPTNPGAATSDAKDYATRNGGPAPATVTVGNGKETNDSITVEVREATPGFFAKVFGIKTVEVAARATARAARLGKARWAMPIVVNKDHPKLKCTPTPCFDESTVLDFYHLKDKGGGKPGAGSFGFVDFAPDSTGTDELAEQIETGWDQYMGTGNHSARTGNPFSAVGDELAGQVGEELLFPVYDKLTGSGTGAQYNIVGWVGFVITSIDLTGSNEKIYGYFTSVVWDAVEADTGTPSDFGARTVVLAE